MVSKSFSPLTIECASSSKHDGGVEVSNDAGHSAGCCDAGLGATIPSLERSQYVGDLGWGGGGESHGDCGRCRVKEKGHWCLGEGTEERAGKAGGGWDRLQGWGVNPPVHRDEQSPSRRLSGHTL